MDFPFKREPDYQELRTLLEFWCKFFPKPQKCVAPIRCEYRFQCKNKQVQCEARTANQNKDTYEELSKAAGISTGAIQGYYRKLWGIDETPLI